MEADEDELELAVRREVGANYELNRALATSAALRAVYGDREGGRRCPTCYRSFVPEVQRTGPGGRGGPIRIYCTTACRRRARSQPREWRWCTAPGCEGYFLALDLRDGVGPGRVTCPPAWPAPAGSPSSCTLARRRATNRDAQRRLRERRAFERLLDEIG